MKRFALAPAAAAACGLLVLGAGAPNVSASSVPTTQMARSDATASDAPHIRGAIADLTVDALTSGDMSRLMGRFYRADEQRIEKSSTYSQGYGSKLDGQIKQLSADWKQKYGHDFSTRGVENALNTSMISIQQGQFGHDASLAALVDKDSTASETKQLNSDQEIAEVRFSAANGLTAVRVPLIRESMNRWRVDIPDSLDAAQLRSNLSAQLSALSANYAHWPADENQAYREVAQRVAMAVLNYPSPRLSASTAQPEKSTAVASTVQPAQVKTVSATSTTPAHSWWKFWSGW